MGISKRQLAKRTSELRGEYESLLKDFVELPTVSADPAHRGDINRCATLAADTIRQFGGTPRILKTEGNPIVHGVFQRHRKAPTLTIYNHLDVQPASRETEPWESEPFQFKVEGDRYRGRGTTDDKGPALAALFAIRLAAEHDIPINIQLLWELEEEIGSPSFEKAISSHASKLKTDSVLVSDTTWVSRQQPACTSGLRGLQSFSFTLQTAETDQHSGTTGGAARNPVGELMKLMTEMHDASTGKVKIKGFYDDVEPLSREELAGFKSCGFSVRQFIKDHRFRSIRTDDPLEVMKRTWSLPTFEVHGLVGGYTGPGMKTIIPPRAEAKVSCRLVPNQTPARIVELVREFVSERNPDVIVTKGDSMEPYRSETTGALPDALRSAVGFAFGREPVFVRSGGSIGAVVHMRNVLEVPIMFLGLSLPEHGYHAPNENFDWRQASGGMVAFARYFEILAKG